MGQLKLRPLAAILKLVDALSEDECADLRDYLRPALKSRKPRLTEPKPERKLRTRKSQLISQASETATGIPVDGCAQCGLIFDDNVHHKTTEKFYHEFVESAGEASKGVGA